MDYISCHRLVENEFQKFVEHCPFPPFRQGLEQKSFLLPSCLRNNARIVMPRVSTMHNNKNMLLSNLVPPGQDISVSVASVSVASASLVPWLAETGNTASWGQPTDMYVNEKLTFPSFQVGEGVEIGLPRCVIHSLTNPHSPDPNLKVCNMYFLGKDIKTKLRICSNFIVNMMTHEY